MATKPATVTKKQLEESGFDNLRDYMNAERGLMRKDGKVALRKGDMDIKSAAEKRSATRMADVAAKKPQAIFVAAAVVSTGCVNNSFVVLLVNFSTSGTSLLFAFVH